MVEHDTPPADSAPEPVEPGTVTTGTIARLVEYGAFVDLPTPEGGTVTGLVHVSEVAPRFVENIYAELTEGQQVQVRVLKIDDQGRLELSIKQVDPEWRDQQERDDRPRKRLDDRDFNRNLRKFMHKSQVIQGEARRQRRSRGGGSGKRGR